MPPDGFPPYFESRSDFQLISFAYLLQSLKLRPWAWLVWNYFDKNKKKLRTLTGTFVLQRKYSFTLDSQYKWFCSSPKVHFVTELEPLKNSDEYYSLSHSVCVTLKTFWKHYISGSQPNLPSDGEAAVDTISNHSFDFLFSEWKIVRITARFCIKWKSLGFWIRIV